MIRNWLNLTYQHSLVTMVDLVPGDIDKELMKVIFNFVESDIEEVLNLVR